MRTAGSRRRCEFRWNRDIWKSLGAGVLLFATLLGLSAPAIAGPVPAGVAAKLSHGSTTLVALWESRGARLPVIVEFAMPALPDGTGFDGTDAADAAHMQAIHVVQDAILGGLLGSPSAIAAAEASRETNLKRMAFSPMFAIRATAGELERLAADPLVLRIHEDGLSAPGLIESLPLIGMPIAYTAGATGSGQHVAVLDTGGRRSHEFLNQRIVSAACYSTTDTERGTSSICPGGVAELIGLNSANDCDAETIFGCGHGTHVAGIAAGFNTNQQAGEPANGVARAARIISINVFSQFPRDVCGNIADQYTGGCLRGFESDIIKGLERVYALRNTFAIAAVNMSIGGGISYGIPCDFDARKPIIDLLRDAGIITVAAAGNSGANGSVSQPACISTVFAVASSTKQDARSSFSNWGPLVDVVAPGSEILSSHVSGNSNTHYASISGTSMAAPHVAGAIAALRSAFPSAGVEEIEDALRLSGVNITSSGSTRPRIRVANALVRLTPPPPANDDFRNRVAISEPGTVPGTSVGATDERGEPNHAGVASARNSVWWSYTPNRTVDLTIDTFGSAFDTVLAVYTGDSVAALTEVASNDDAGGGTRSRVAFRARSGTPYAIVVAGKDNAGGNISLTLATPPPPPVNDDFASRIAIPGPGTVAGTNAGATEEAGEPVHAARPDARTSVWWRYTPTVSGDITVDTFGSGFDTVLAVYTGSSVANLTEVASNDDADGGRQSRVLFRGVAGTSYAIAVAGKAGASDTILLTVAGGGGANTTTIVAAVTPVTRATQVGTTVTAFATVINSGGATATSCVISVPPGDPLTFGYRSRDHVTGALGTVNQPVNIAAGARQDFLMAFMPTAAMQRELALAFDCTNTPPAPSVVGLNTFLLIGTSSAPPADILSIAVTASNDGIMNIPLGGTGFAALAAQNIGAPALIQARLSAASILSSQTQLANTTAMVICRTDPNTGACLERAAATVDFTPGANEMVTFTAFAMSDGREIVFDPASTRLFVHFFQGQTPVGSASVAARTVPAAPGLAAWRAD